MRFIIGVHGCFFVPTFLSMLLTGCLSIDPTSIAKRYVVEVYEPNKVFAGTTIFGDTSEFGSPLIVEVDMNGNVTWVYEIPGSRPRRANGGMDVEWIPRSDDILFVLPRDGVYQVNRKKEIVWSYSAPVSHDADRLPNGNTLMAWGWGEDSSDPEVREVDAKGNVVWKWHAAEHLKNFRPRRGDEGYTHTNAVVRLNNGNTLVSLRNFFMLAEVNRSGEIVWTLENLRVNPHDPEELPNGNILVNTRRPQVIKEYTKSGDIVWRHRPEDANIIRYNHKLPNGNILFVERRKIVEITSDGEVVWQLRLKDVGTDRGSRNRWFYKAERIPARR